MRCNNMQQVTSLGGALSQHEKWRGRVSRAHVLLTKPHPSVGCGPCVRAERGRDGRGRTASTRSSPGSAAATPRRRERPRGAPPPRVPCVSALPAPRAPPAPAASASAWSDRATSAPAPRPRPGCAGLLVAQAPVDPTGDRAFEVEIYMGWKHCHSMRPSIACLLPTGCFLHSYCICTA